MTCLTHRNWWANNYIRDVKWFMSKLLNQLPHFREVKHAQINQGSRHLETYLRTFWMVHLLTVPGFLIYTSIKEFMSFLHFFTLRYIHTFFEVQEIKLKCVNCVIMRNFNIGVLLIVSMLIYYRHLRIYFVFFT